MSPSNGILQLKHSLVDMEMSSSAVVVVFILKFVFTWLGVLENLTVCYVMIRSKRIWKNISSFLIFHLSFTDIVFRAVISPLEMNLVTPDVNSSNDGQIQCKILNFMSRTCSAAIFLTLLAISIDRYRNILSPLKARVQKQRRVLAVTLVWFCAGAASVSFIPSTDVIVTRFEKYQASENTTGADYESKNMCLLRKDLETQVALTVYFTTSFVIPLVLITVLYTRVIIYLSRRSNKGMMSGQVAFAKSKSIRMMAIIVFGFALTSGPIIIVDMLFYIFNSESLNTPRKHVLATSGANLLQHCSSLINPIIYCFYSVEFRKDAANLCFCVCRKWKFLPLRKQLGIPNGRRSTTTNGIQKGRSRLGLSQQKSTSRSQITLQEKLDGDEN